MTFKPNWDRAERQRVARAQRRKTAEKGGKTARNAKLSAVTEPDPNEKKV
jgi:hypothetical protein